LMILTNAAAKRDFYLIRHFGVKMSPAPRHTQHQDVLGIKIVASSCPTSNRSHQAVLLRSCADKKNLSTISSCYRISPLFSQSFVPIILSL